MLLYLAEFVGTFVFVSVVLLNSNNALAIAAALFVAIHLATNVQGAGAFNPTVTLVQYFNKSISQFELAGGIAAQLLGAAAAFYYHKQLKQ